LRRSVERGIEHVMLDPIAEAARPGRLETTEQVFQGLSAAMPDQIGDVLDEYDARPEGRHEVRHDGKEPIVLIRLGLVMVAVPDLAESLAWGTGSQEIHGPEVAAVFL
jgi:hypothetical protein